MPKRKRPLPNTIKSRTSGISGGEALDTTSGQTIRTRREMAKRLLGATWLGPQATLEEYCVGLWFQQHNVKYWYQAPFAGYRLNLHTDFMVLHTAPILCIEVQGDKYHGGAAEVAADRERILLLMAQGAMVIQMWGHDIVGGYTGFNPPTDAQFDYKMQAAMHYSELSTEFGSS